MAFDTAGSLYIADESDSRIRKVSVNGVITTVAGTGDSGSSGDGGLATSAQILRPTALATDISGNLYIAEGAVSLVFVRNSSTLVPGPPRIRKGDSAIRLQPAGQTLNAVASAASELTGPVAPGRDCSVARIRSGAESAHSLAPE